MSNVRTISSMIRFAYFILLFASGACLAEPTLVERQTPAVSTSGSLVEDIGIETLGGVFTPLLSRGCKIPCSSTLIFSTADDRQPEIKLTLFRGNAKLTENAHSLGVLVVLGVPPEPRGMPQVAVTFLVEGKQISVTAFDKKTKRSLEIKRREF
jgi:molecular chaperone DnaK (HSP70)